MLRSPKLQDVLRRPVRPSIKETFAGTIGLIRRTLSSPLLALAIAVAAWTFPDVHLQKIFRWGLAVVALAAMEVIIAHIRQWWKYLRTQEELLRGVRSVILQNANIDDDGAGSSKFTVIGLENDSGTVNLVISLPKKAGLKVGSRLAAIVSATDAVWGWWRSPKLLAIEQKPSR